MGKGKDQPFAEWVDWVELGSRGWNIQPSGAKLTDGWDKNVAHMDWKTGAIRVVGDRKFVRMALDDLETAGALPPGKAWVVSPYESTSTDTFPYTPSRPLVGVPHG